LPTRGKKPSLCPICRKEAKKIRQRAYSRNFYNKYLKYPPERLLLLSPIDDEDDNTTIQPGPKPRAPYRDCKPTLIPPTLRFDLAIKNKAKLLNVSVEWIKSEWLPKHKEFLLNYLII